MTFCPPDPSSPFAAVPCPPPGAQAAHLALNMCLADDTPIAIILEENTSPGAAPTTLGWTNLVTGVFTPGNPPAGTHACGVDRLVELGGLLCDTQPDGSVTGTALLEITYDDDGVIISTRLINPVTGATYVPTGVMQPCSGEVGCLDPVQFCFTGTSTGPVDHPGRQYDITLPINPGFAVASLQIDAVNHPANLEWSIFDADGSAFATALQTFIDGRMPASATVTVTNPNAGSPVCGQAIPMTIHIECLRLDQSPPTLVELVYNAGFDLVQNPAYLTTPPTNLNGPQFVYLKRSDAGGTLNCTGVANRGWETNDLGPNLQRDFEVWGTGPTGLQQQSNATPTPRGTPIQEITADINDTGFGPTIWQTFNVPVAGNFIAKLVHGARDPGEQHTIRLSTGDTNDTGLGDVINNITSPPSVTNTGGPNPWTQFQQNVPLGAGLYTFSFQTTNPVGPNRGGLFTDMRVYLDAPGVRATATDNDTTCVVTVQETDTTTDCQLWSPVCSNGQIISWRNVETGQVLSNAAFWGQSPAPQCCLPSASSTPGTGSTTNANLVHNYEICGIVGGTAVTLNRVVITDPSGGILAETIIGPNGAPVVPSSYTIGSCTSNSYVNDEILCDNNGPFLRKYVQALDSVNQVQVIQVRDFTLAGIAYNTVGPVVDNCPGVAFDTRYLCDDNGIFARTFIYDADNGSLIGSLDRLFTTGLPYVTVGVVIDCVPVDVETQILCDDNGEFLREFHWYQKGGVFANTTNWLLDRSAPYIPVGTVGICSSLDFEEEILCDNNGAFIRRFTRNTDGLTTTADFNLAGAAYTTVGTVVVCPATTTVITERDVEIVTLCDDNGGFLRRFVYDESTGLPTTIVTTDFDGNPYVTVGTVKVCAQNISVTELNSELEFLCDGGTTTFIRRYLFNETTGAITGTADFTLAGVAYVPAGAVTAGTCSQPVTVSNFPANQPVTVTNIPHVVVDNFPVPVAELDSETHVMCDGGTTTFLRQYTFDETTGAITGHSDYTLAGAAYVPVGTVTAGSCPSVTPTEFDAEFQVVCDSTGATFLRAYRFNEATGAFTSFIDITFAGVPFVPVGAVGECSGCCVVSQVCLINGHPGVVLRFADGTFHNFDTITGLSFLGTDVTPCPLPVVTLNSQHRLVVPGSPWSPGSDVVGTLTGFTYIIISGTATIVDSNGTSATLPAGVTATWNVIQDGDTLLGPTSVTADPGSSVYCVWTQR